MSDERVEVALVESNRLLDAKKLEEAASLLESVFDDRNVDVANLLAYIYSLTEFRGTNLLKSIELYKIGATLGNGHSAHGLAGCLRRLGQPQEALSWLEKAANLGEDAAAYSAFLHYDGTGNIQVADKYLDMSAAAGNPRALQRKAIKMLTGRRGSRNIVPGLFLYFQNIPRLFRV